MVMHDSPQLSTSPRKVTVVGKIKFESPEEVNALLSMRMTDLTREKTTNRAPIKGYIEQNTF